MRFRPRNVRSRLTLWYVLVLASLLALYAGVASLFLFLSLREDFDQNLLQDLETVEGMLAKEPNGGVSLHASHPDAAEPRIGHFIEVWSPEGALLYRSAALQGQALGGPLGPEEGLHDPTPSTARLPNGVRVRLASSVYHVEDRRVVVRVAYSEEGLWRELGEFGQVLLLGFPVAVLLAGVGGYALARKVLAPIDSMATQSKKIHAETESLLKRIEEIRQSPDEKTRIGIARKLLENIDEKIRNIEEERILLLHIRNIAMQEASEAITTLQMEQEGRRILLRILDEHDLNVEGISTALNLRESLVRQILAEFE